jgi:acetylornithine/N-succinyldiaminopimelate aminotransferase
MTYLMNTYARLPVVFERGQGVWVWDEQGKQYLDALAGIAVSGLGHAHPKLVKALSEQAAKLIHTSNIYGVRHQETLAQMICERSGMQEVLFCNSGAEANEAAIKLARLSGYQQGKTFIKTIVMERAWHGRTITTLAATGSEKARKGFAPLQDECFVRVPYNDLEAIQQAAAAHPEINSVLLEVLQGEGGINVADSHYLQQLRHLCDERGWLLMLDEVQCGIGRTGKWFGYQHSGITPDVITLAKGLGSGVPIGAIAAQGRAAGVFTPGSHGTTFGGGPLVCAAGITTLTAMQDEGLLQNADIMGNYLVQAFKQSLQGNEGVIDIRGKGLMLGIELNKPCGILVQRALEAGLLINVTRDNVVRLLPPLIIQQEEAALLVQRLTPLIQQFLQE